MSFLDEVVDGVKESLDSGYYDVPNSAKTPVALAKKSLKSALQNQFAIIAEIKPRSPTAGTLFKGAPSELAQSYADAGAGALSVLCEAMRFGGRLENLAQAKKAGLPVLAKDFVISEKQLQAYAHYGADTALLIYELFERKKTQKPLDEMIALAHGLGLEVLLEVHGPKGLRHAPKTNADVIGINNRNLDDLSLNVLHFQNALAESGLDIAEIQKSGKTIIAESGFETTSEIQMARNSGINGVLIGTGLLKQQNPALALKQLTGCARSAP